MFMKDGEKTTWNTFVYYAVQSDIVLFGELHNNTIAHWLQYELVRDLNKAKKGKIVVGAEMFESDDQIKIDEYFKGLYSRRRFESEMKLWPNYKTDYRPILEYSKKNGISFVATNVPRRYASLVFKRGWKGLSEITLGAKKFIAPLPIPYDENIKSYKKINSHIGRMKHRMKHLAKAQALKDATMAHFIFKNSKIGHTFIHLNGAYHSRNFEGIYWYLKKYNPAKKILVITTVNQRSLSQLKKKYYNSADFVLVVPETMIRSH